MRKEATAILIASVALGGAVLADEPAAFRIDPARSQIEIHVGRGGFLKVFGHDHRVAAREISGDVHFDPERIDASSVAILVKTDSLRVVDPGESEEDRRKVQQTMQGEQVLDAKRYPEIRFVATEVALVKRSGDGWELTVVGRLALHGAEKTVRLPLRVELEDGALRVRGALPLLQTDFGITPIRVAGGTVRVKDKLDIDLDVVAVPR